MDVCANKMLTSPRRRWYTLPDANRSLVLVGRIVRDIIREHARVLELQEVLEQAPGQDPARGQAGQELRLLINRLGGFLQELDEMSVLLIDYSQGVVDFPSQFSGREIYLSWHAGQEQIGSWHEVGGEAQPITLLSAQRSALAQPAGV